MRVNKHIAETGFCSRREADRLIAERRVTVNGIAAGVGAVVGEGDEVRVDGQAIKARTVKAGNVCAELRYGPPQRAGGMDRRTWAQVLRRDIGAMLN